MISKQKHIISNLTIQQYRWLIACSIFLFSLFSIQQKAFVDIIYKIEERSLSLFTRDNVNNIMK